ncbi:MAG: hypothetical protein FXF49_03435 [Flexistipes sinusarabici]|uniref:Uncharacterized protein n=1 Tax=Flexistipes sinusarabici TaxID=2352 RepID=A0A5D0MJS9_FLESI|nr:hypothetical protein [Flexistipes sinusarabici]TYB33937.1 MAG: hypothetical protein FXF49_03435 [Flexistipes sinusarabici]
MYSGILLLFKHKLAEMSPPVSDEVLIKQTVLPEVDEDGAIAWTGKGKKTVDVQKIRERFESLDIEVDWNRIEAIQKYRNNIEHYYSEVTTEAVKKLISDCFIVISRFVCVTLEADPKSLFGDEEWTVLVSLNEAYQREKEECVNAIRKIDWKSDALQTGLEEMICASCGSGLIIPNDEYPNCFDASFICRICDQELDYSDVVEGAIEQYEANRSYRHYKDGGGPILGTCPCCWSETLYLGRRILPSMWGKWPLCLPTMWE